MLCFLHALHIIAHKQNLLKTPNPWLKLATKKTTLFNKLRTYPHIVF